MLCGEFPGFFRGVKRGTNISMDVDVVECQTLLTGVSPCVVWFALDMR
jgi:hypothetical protein